MEIKYVCMDCGEIHRPPYFEDDCPKCGSVFYWEPKGEALRLMQKGSGGDSEN